jgi:hypothetical protein
MPTEEDHSVKKERKPLSGKAKNRIYVGIMIFFAAVLIVLVAITISVLKENAELKKQASTLTSTSTAQRQEESPETLPFDIEVR